MPTRKYYVAPAKIIVRPTPMTDYYDHVLGFVPFALVGVTLALRAAGVEYLFAVSAGAALASLAVGHALFVNGPTPRDGITSADGTPDAPATDDAIDAPSVTAD